MLFMALSAAEAGPTAFDDVRGAPYKVGWTPRVLTINGAPEMLLSGDVHCEWVTGAAPPPPQHHHHHNTRPNRTLTCPPTHTHTTTIPPSPHHHPDTYHNLDRRNPSLARAMTPPLRFDPPPLSIHVYAAS